MGFLEAFIGMKFLACLIDLGLQGIKGLFSFNLFRGGKGMPDSQVDRFIDKTPATVTQQLIDTTWVKAAGSHR